MNNIIKLFVGLIGGLMLVSSSIGQTPIAHFDFDACSINDLQGTYNNNMVVGNPVCECGPANDAITFDGVADYLILDDGIKQIFENDFTISFYFWLENAAENYNLFAIKKDDCLDVDSTMHIQFVPSQQEIEFNFINNLGDRIDVTGELNNNLCWHHAVITKAGSSYAFFLDEAFVQNIDLGTIYVMAPTAEVTIGNSECQALGEQLLNGKIDEFMIFDRVLSTEEIAALQLYPDQIITDDTTVFEGESVDVMTGVVCASNFSWTNTGDFDDASALEPIITPSLSTTYELFVDHGACTVTDTIRINVLDSELVDCSGLLLPTAFTPNGDGLNDTYGISNDFIVDELMYFEIFDRWGTRVFETNSIDQRWDGNYKSSPLSPASYVYKIKYQCRGDEFVKTGNFNILR